ncbi:MAG: hypothetical protein ACHQ3P_00500 [Candidatus Limnocylindrales bacterium]
MDLPDPNEPSLPPDERIVVFDDRELFHGDAAILIQPSMPSWAGGGGRADRVLAGYAYAPIGDAVRRHRPAINGGVPADPYIVVCFGGSDPFDVTGRLAPALGAFPGARTVIVVGADYRGSIVDGGLDVRRDPDDFIDLIAGATVVVGSAGTIKFEAAYLGRPMILVAVVDDQLPVAPPFAATGASRYLGDGRRVSPDVVRRATIELLGDEVRRSAYGARGRSIVDGRGADRIVEAVAELVRVAPTGSGI